MPVALPDGYYAVRCGADSYRLIWLTTATRGIDKKDAKYRRILFYKKGPRWEDFAFLNDDGTVQLYVKFVKTWTPAQLHSIRSAVMEIRRNPHEAQWLYEQLEVEQ